MPHQSNHKKIFSARWISKEEILIFLSYDWESDSISPSLYFDTKENPIHNIKRSTLLSFAKYSGYFIKDEYITFICPPCEKKVYLGANFNDWGNAIGKESYLFKSTLIENEQVLSLNLPFNEYHNNGSKILFKFVTEEGYWLEVPEDAPNLIIENNFRNYQLHPTQTGYHVFDFFPTEVYDPAKKPHQILWIEGDYTEIWEVDDLGFFLTLFSDRALGSIVDGRKTTFRLFAPRAEMVKVSYYDTVNHCDHNIVNLNRNDDFSWEVTVPENLHGYYYHYNIKGTNYNANWNFDEQFNIVDPYARAMASPKGPGIILDNKKVIKRSNNKFSTPAWHNLIILEVHLRDLVGEKKGFLDLARWIKSKDNYIKELGVNAIELLPIQEYETDSPESYEWGYMPVNYFSPASSYASNPQKYSQINEFKEVVRGFHDMGVAVILDVVYNHMGSPNPLLYIDKRYYFETAPDGSLINYSGCGNDIRANTPMGKRLIIDSLIHLVKMYNVDGFRFDLSELLGIGVLKEIEAALKAVKSSIILIAEPWSFHGHIAYDLKFTGFASWNDGYREFIAQYLHGQGNLDGFKYFIEGSLKHLSSFPAQSINYAASHDDYCWLDKITENPNHDGCNPTVNDIRRTHLMIAMLMMSIGMPMLAEGQDFLHSKQGVHNTYNKPELNFLNYKNMLKYPQTHQYFRRWIHFRLSKKGQGLRLEEKPSEGYLKFFTKKDSSAAVVLYNADKSLKNAFQLLFAINPTDFEETISLNGEWKRDFVQIADIERFDEKGLEGAVLELNEGGITLPPLSCALWACR